MIQLFIVHKTFAGYTKCYERNLHKFEFSYRTKVQAPNMNKYWIIAKKRTNAMLENSNLKVYFLIFSDITFISSRFVSRIAIRKQPVRISVEIEC
jgi:hypothetical protein